jgi:hypothetical protein
MRRLWPNLGVALASTALCLAALEGAARLAAPRAALGHKAFHGFNVADPDLSYDIRPNAPPSASTLPEAPGVTFPIWSNELGCYDEPYRKEPGRKPVLLVGDSFTQGSVSFDKSYGTLLQGLLGERVLKCGVNGYGTRQEVLKAGKIIAKAGAPSLLIAGYFHNDVEDDYLFPSRTVIGGWMARRRYISSFETGAIEEKSLAELEKTAAIFAAKGEVFECPKGSSLQKLRCALQERSALYRRVKPGLKALILKLGETDLVAKDAEFLPYLPYDRLPWLRKAYAEHFKNLDALNALARRHGAKTLIVVIPTKEQVYPFLAPAGVDVERSNELVVAHLSARGIPHLNLLPGFRERADLSPRKALDSEKDLYWKNDGHWNFRGNELAALLLARHIAEKGLLPLKPEAK